MTTDECVEIARAAKKFQLDQQLSYQKRRVAQSLYELASQLTDPDYGCPTEIHAITLMYHHLLNAAPPTQENSASASSDKRDLWAAE